MPQKAVLLVSSPIPASPPVFNRIGSILLHVPYYSIEGAARLAKEAGLSRSTVSRLIRGQVVPSCKAVWQVTMAIAIRFGKLLDPREIFSADGTYPTPSVCELMGCKGCLPPEAWCERTDTIKPEWRNQKPGEWFRLQASPIVPGTETLPKLHQ